MIHITTLFMDFAGARQSQLRRVDFKDDDPGNGFLDRLLTRYPKESDADRVRKALLDPYFPLGMLERTLFADVTGMRFFINKRRPDLEPELIDELRMFSGIFLRIRRDIETHYDPETITCIPLDDTRHNLPTGQWCTFCGVCCQVGGVPPKAPPGISYPDHWPRYLAGDGTENQQSCPFILQYFGEYFFFCAIHNVKPVGCRQFGEQDCRKRLTEGRLHLS